MNASDFRRIALSLDDVEESSHMGAADFRIGGHIFATLAMEDQGFGNLKFTPELQEAFVKNWPETFLPIPGGWGKIGMTHVRLHAVDENLLVDALTAAWELRKNKNKRSKR